MRKMSYWTCPYCGSNLDHGEKCDCDKERIRKERMLSEYTSVDRATGQVSLRMDKIGGAMPA